MEESNSQGLEDVIARRLIKQAETEFGAGELTQNSDTHVDGGGETEKEKLDSALVDEPAQSSPTGVLVGDTEPASLSATGIATSPAPEFAKVEKSLISL